VSDFKLKVIAETQTAERSLKQVGEVADKATKARSLDIKVPSLSGVTKTFQTLERDVKSAANTINTFYKVGKALPGNFGESVRAIENVGKGAAKSAIALNNNNTAAEIFSNTLKSATGAAGQLVTTLAKVGFATFAIKETVGVLQAAFTGFFNNTIGREVKLRETILKTQTTLASTNKVFKDGKEITDPYQKIVTLTGAVRKNIDSIRERSIALAGVTSGEVIEVFGIVASQVGQIGGGLKEAEDLAINFAAALGTFGIPLYQARQEVGSILRGDITVDSYLAKALGITNEDIAKAKTATGGVVKFLEERLAAAVAGQRIAAEGFSGVVSNIKDLGELIGQNFGTGMLQPLLHSLTAVFETLFRIRTQIFDIASKAGETVGRVGTLVVGLTAGRTGVGKGVDASAAASAAAGVANKAFTEIETVAQRTVGAISQVIAALQPTALILADAFRNIVEAFVQIKVGAFEALASALANVATAAGTVAPAFATIFNLYARFLNTPIVKYFAEVATVLALLKRAGLDAATSLLLFGKFIISSVIPALGVFGTAAGAVVAGIAAIGLAIGKLVLVLAGLASALVTPAAAIPAVAAAFQALSASLTNVGNQAVGANTKLASLGKGLTTLGATAKAAGGALLASLGWVVAFQVGIAVVVDAVGRFQRAQEDQKSSARAAEALRRLKTTYKDVGDSADSATKAARDFEQAIVNAQYDRNIDALEKVREKINQIRYELKPGIQSWGEFWAAASGEEMGKFEARAQSALAAGLAEEAKLKGQLSSVDAQRDRKLGEENVKLIANKKIDLSKEIAELERQQQNDLFQQRQTLAQKEVEIFRAAGELRIFQMEQANAKLIEGEEGASRTALEALNNYLSVRENGELAIEAAKKEITIEVANLEKTIADYRFENEKKIAEIRKRAGENEKAMADARRQAEGQGPQLTGGGAFDTGLRTGPAPVIGGSADYHQDLSFGPGVDLRQQRELMVQLAESYDAMGRKIVLSNAGVAGREFPLKGTAQQQNEFILNAQSAHRNRPGGGRTAIDFYAPTKTDPKGRFGSSVVNQPMLAPTIAGGKTNYFAGGAGGAGVELTKDGASILKLIHGRTDIPLPSGGNAAARSGATPAAPAAAPTPALQSPDVGAPSVKAYAEAVRGVASAMERVRALQAALTEAQTVAAFEAIAKAAFPQVQLEGYEDNLFTVQATYDAVAASAAGAFDPERAAITIDRTMKIAAANREVKQITDEIAKRPNITEKERSKLADDLAAKKKNFLADLAKEEEAKKRILAVQRATDFITQTQADTKAIYDNIEVLELRNRLRFEGVDPAVIAGAEALLLNERRMVEATKLLNEQLAIEYAERDRLQKLKATADAAALPALQEQLDAALAEIARLERDKGTVQATGFAQAGAINAQTAAETEPGAKIRAFIGDAKRELADLEAVAIRISQSIGDAIGSSLANGIMGLIEGTTTAKEVFANFLKSIGQILVQEGTKMIAMYIAIAIAKAIAGMGSNFTGGTSSAVPTDAAGWGSSFNTQLPGITSIGKIGFAKGGAFTNSIVSSPTLFKFANGGTTQMGEMGEAGPEAIMPLSRGRGGRLGVDASGLREAMDRQQGGSSGSPVLNMSFQSTSINGVEYVSRDQLESAMAETRRNATRDGAKRGMTMTLDRIQNSSSTRRKVGI
jgi:phosphopantetheine adenylyltransferase